MDVSIYDNPNILVGDPKIEKYAIAKKNLNNTFDLMPDDGKTYTEFVKILKEWHETENYEKWKDAFDYFSNLKIKDYLRLVSHFPQILLKQTPNTFNEEAYKLFKRYSIYYSSSIKILALDFLSYDVSPNLFLKSENFDLCKPKAKVMFEKLNLCQALVRHPYGKFFEESFSHGANLWFWWEVSDCLKKVQHLLAPKSAKEVLSKTKLNDIETQRVNYLAGTSENISYTEIKGMKHLFYHLGDIIETQCREIANQDTDFQDGVLSAYESSRRIARRKYSRSNQYQYTCLHQTNNEVMLFESVQGRKTPSSKGKK